MFAQLSRANLSRPMSVPPGSPRQPAGGGGKGGGAGSQAAGSPGKGGGGRPMRAFGNINNMGSAIGASAPSGTMTAQPANTVHASMAPSLGSFNPATFNMPAVMPSAGPNVSGSFAPVGNGASRLQAAIDTMPYMPPSIPTPSPQQPIPSPINPVVGTAQPMPYMPPSIPTPSPQRPVPRPQIPVGLMQRLQSFGGF